MKEIHEDDTSQGKLLRLNIDEDLMDGLTTMIVSCREDLNGYADLPGIGKVKVVMHRLIPIGFSVKKGTIKLEADGWYISLSIEDKTVPI